MDINTDIISDLVSSAIWDCIKGIANILINIANDYLVLKKIISG